MAQKTKRVHLRRTPGLDSYIEKNWIPEQLSDTETAPSFPDREADDRKGSSDPHELPSFESMAAMSYALTDGLKMEADHIRALGEEGTVRRESFARAIAEFGTLLQEDDTFLFYFSGHGMGGTLLFTDGAVSLQSIVDYISRLAVRRKVVILDCCYAGEPVLPQRHRLSFEDSIAAFAGKGIVLMASSAADEEAWLTEKGSRSLFTELLARAMLSRRLIRRGKLSLPDIFEEVRYLMEQWNRNHPDRAQHPVYRDNLVGTLYFDVEEYRPYVPRKITYETMDYKVQSVKPLSTQSQKRLAAFVILKNPDDTLLPTITKEIAAQIKNAEIYASENSEMRFKGHSADVIWCYFGYDEADLTRGNHFAYTIWTEDENLRQRYFREGSSSEISEGIYIFWNTSYEMVRNIFESDRPDDDILKEYRGLLTGMINQAEDFIRDYSEWKNGTISDDRMRERYAPWAREIRKQFYRLTEADAAPLYAAPWAEAALETAGWIVDLTLQMDQAEVFGKNYDGWLEETTIRRIHQSIDRFMEAEETFETIKT